VARIKTSSKLISLLLDDNVLITEPTEFEEHVLTYFQNIFGGENNCMDNGLVAKVIPTLVSM